MMYLSVPITELQHGLIFIYVWFLHIFRKLGDGLFLECCKEVAAQHPDIEFENMIVDNCSMQVCSVLKSRGRIVVTFIIFSVLLRKFARCFISVYIY